MSLGQLLASPSCWFASRLVGISQKHESKALTWVCKRHVMRAYFTMKVLDDGKQEHDLAKESQSNFKGAKKQR